MNLEQYIHPNIGLFFKTSWNDGKSATWAFTEIDQSTSIGVHIKGTIWNRVDDNIGLGYVENGISKEHQNYPPSHNTKAWEKSFQWNSLSF